MSYRRLHVKLVIAVLLTLTAAHAQDKPAPDPYITLSQETLKQQLKTIDGQSLTLSDHSEAITIINLFARWCGPCRMNLTDLVDLKTNYHKNPIVIIGIVSGENEPDRERVIEFAREMKIDFQVVWDTDNFSQTLVDAVKGRAVIPQTFIIDTHGRIRRHFSGYNPTHTPELLRQALDDVAANPDADRPARPESQ